MNTTRALLLTASVVLGAASARGDVISGRIVDSNGAGVPGVNIDAEDSNGDRVTVDNGGTDADGFFNATLDPGVYDIVFTAPPPPTTTHLIEVVEGVVVVGTVNMGTIALDRGVVVSGRVLRPGGAAAASVNIDVVDPAGANRRTDDDSTDALGTFSIVFPVGPSELRFDTSGLAGPLAPDRLFLDLSSNTNVGDLFLEAGLVVSATIQRSGGTPVQGADVDVIEAGTGEERYTPGDDTNGSGLVGFVVPAGTYDIEICPKFSDRLVATTLTGIVVNSNTNLGIVSLQAGVVLSGDVQASGSPVQNVDLDAFVQGSGTEITLCADNTNAAGHYAVVVPTGIFDMEFTPPTGIGLASKTINGVSINGDTVLDVDLDPAAELGTRICSPAVPNSTGFPGSMFVFGSSVVADDDLFLEAVDLPPQSNIGYFIMGTGTNTFTPPGSSGPICVAPGIKRFLPPVNNTSQLGGGFNRAVGTSGPVSSNITPGSTWGFQAWHRDGMSPSNLTDAIQVTFQ